MWGVAWVLFVAVLVVLGTIVAFALTLWAPIFALMVLIVAAIFGFAYLGGKRTQIGTERERIDRGEVGAQPDRQGRPASGEGAAPGSGDDERYEPAL